jgi:hypothetical protein
MAGALFRTMWRQSSGFAKPLNKVIPQPKTTLAGCIKMAGALVQDDVEFRTM